MVVRVWARMTASSPGPSPPAINPLKAALPMEAEAPQSKAEIATNRYPRTGCRTCSEGTLECVLVTVSVRLRSLASDQGGPGQNRS